MAWSELSSRAHETAMGGRLADGGWRLAVERRGCCALHRPFDSDDLAARAEPRTRGVGSRRSVHHDLGARLGLVRDVSPAVVALRCERVFSRALLARVYGKPVRD